MTRPPITVGDVYDPEQRASVVVGPDEHLEDVLREFSEHPSVRGIFVCDESGRFLGAVTRTDLLNWARLRLASALDSVDLPRDRIVRLARLMHASTVADVIHPGSHETGVRPDEPLDHALRMMLRDDIIAIPVVDADNHILGDLSLAQVMRYLLCEPNPDA